MSSAVPAIKGRMGNMDYYILSLKAADLIRFVKTPREIAGWDQLSLEERYQRDINLSRVKKQLAPYWAENPSHFFGSIIVMPHNPKVKDISDHFEPIGEIAGATMPNLYKEAVKDIGVLTIPSGTILVPLDGQHRAKAIEFAIVGTDAKEQEITGFVSNAALGQEDISVLLVVVNAKKARSIFTHVNRYAKPTSASQNYVTSDDDILAVIAREIANKKISADLVNYKTNQLNAKDKYFTTLSTIHNCPAALAKSILPSKLDTKTLPDKDTQVLLRGKAHEVWDVLLSGIEDFQLALHDKSETGNTKRIELRKESLLARPVTQECVFRAFLELTKSPTNFSDTDAVDKLNALPWTLTEEHVEKFWGNVLWSGDAKSGKMITKNRDLASKLIFYWAGGHMRDEEKEELLAEYQKQFTEANKPKELPPPF